MSIPAADSSFYQRHAFVKRKCSHVSLCQYVGRTEKARVCKGSEIDSIGKTVQKGMESWEGDPIGFIGNANGILKGSLPPWFLAAERTIGFHVSFSL